VIKLIDFSAAKEYKHWKDEDTVLMGTKAYAAPEQYGYAITDHKTDMYGLGATLFHLLTGTCYSPAGGFAMYTGKLLPVIMKCLQIDPANRYADVTALKNDMTAILSGRKRGVRWHMFPDLVGASRITKAILLPLYAILTFILISALLFGPDYGDGISVMTWILIFSMFVAPYLLICNVFGTRSRLPMFRDKTFGGILSDIILVFIILLCITLLTSNVYYYLS
jgi:hypothetical protein